LRTRTQVGFNEEPQEPHREEPHRSWFRGGGTQSLERQAWGDGMERNEREQCDRMRREPASVQLSSAGVEDVSDGPGGSSRNFGRSRMQRSRQVGSQTIAANLRSQ
jgi:hypothetical protein